MTYEEYIVKHASIMNKAVSYNAIIPNLWGQSQQQLGAIKQDIANSTGASMNLQGASTQNVVQMEDRTVELQLKNGETIVVDVIINPSPYAQSSFNPNMNDYVWFRDKNNTEYYINRSEVVMFKLLTLEGKMAEVEKAVK